MPRIVEILDVAKVAGHCIMLMVYFGGRRTIVRDDQGKIFKVLGTEVWITTSPSCGARNGLVGVLRMAPAVMVVCSYRMTNTCGDGRRVVSSYTVVTGTVR